MLRACSLLVVSLSFFVMVCSVGCVSERVVDPQADEVLRAMGETLAGAKGLSFRAQSTVDEMLESGQIVQYSSTRKVLVRRPDRLALEADGDLFRRRVWYDGQTLTVLDVDANAYATIDVPTNIDEMLDLVIGEYDLTVPLADVLYRDPYKILIENVETGEYLGVPEVDGHPCHHLAFQQEVIDWQVWIDAGEVPVPRKVVITYTRLPGRPQFRATLSEWNLSPTLSERMFEPRLPADAEQVAMDDLFGPEEGE